MVGINSVDQGQVYLNRKSNQDYRTYKHFPIGIFIGQNYLLEHLSVIEHLLLWKILYKLSSLYISQIIHIFGLKKFLN